MGSENKKMRLAVCCRSHHCILKEAEQVGGRGNSTSLSVCVCGSAEAHWLSFLCLCLLLSLFLSLSGPSESVQFRLFYPKLLGSTALVRFVGLQGIWRHEDEQVSKDKHQSVRRSLPAVETYDDQPKSKSNRAGWHTQHDSIWQDGFKHGTA